MKLRRVITENGPEIEALKPDTTDVWLRLSGISILDEIHKRFDVENNLANSMLDVLKLGTDGWQMLTEALSLCDDKQTVSGHVPILPYEPLSFRDFLLFEKHFIDASRCFVKKFLPKTYKVMSLYERMSKRTHPKFKPSSIWYERPLYYFGNHLNFVTSGTDIKKPDYTNALDYELELGAILAKSLFNATPDEAERAIGGYVVLNDLSARDVQMAEMRSGFGPQKAKHFLNGISSVVVTADEISDRVNQLQASVTIDGIKRADCHTETMQYSLGEAIAYVSRSEMLYPGELFGSGTLPGGSGVENGFWLQENNQLSLKINGVSELVNRVVW